MFCSAKSLVRELLTTNPSKRLTASQALQHTWFTASLHSNEDLRLARRNMKRHLRQRFKVITVMIMLMLTACISSKLEFRGLW
jgi:serine/threonine protein kinase